MATLILENVPKTLYESLERRAVAGHRSVPAETVQLLQQVLDVKDPPPAEADATHETASEDAETGDDDRPWRGVFVPTRPRDTLFVQAVEKKPFPKRTVAINLGWHRTESDDA